MLIYQSHVSSRDEFLNHQILSCVQSVFWWYFGVALISHLTGGFRKQTFWHDFFGNLSSDTLRQRHSRHIFVQSDFWKLHNNLKILKALNGRLSGNCLHLSCSSVACQGVVALNIVHIDISFRVNHPAF